MLWFVWELAGVLTRGSRLGKRARVSPAGVTLLLSKTPDGRRPATVRRGLARRAAAAQGGSRAIMPEAGKRPRARPRR